MENASQPETPQPPQAVPLKIFGVGNAGLNLLRQTAPLISTGAVFAAVNTDAGSLESCAGMETLCLESRPLRGLGTGADPERGRDAAEQNLPLLKSACAGARSVFILAGLGGGTGTGVSPYLARVAKDAGALVLAFVTQPFDCEGNRRIRQAQQGLEELRAVADAVICLPNQKLFRLMDENTSVVDAFRLSDELLAECAAGVWRLMTSRALIQIHFDDLCAFLGGAHGETFFATADASGPARSAGVVEKLLSHPMLDSGAILSEADAVLVSIIGGSDLTIAEVNTVMKHVNDKCRRAQVLMGAALDDSFQGRISVTLVATKKTESLAARAGLNESEHAAGMIRETPVSPLPHAAESRRHARVVSQASDSAADRREEAAGGAGTRGRRGTRTGPRLRQGQLPLEIVSKGRFDKSEPTIHKGEDLDVPTYIRRGVALN
ncbi:MAG TPA: hypothetical protein GYA07_16855 [Verrucomicrobia bacterium]|nr:hypothetical protein [Verrucomicrobiota bacterium]HOP97236.1 cell division protein FtsZ [Verrucomicrobiota bacterium]